jgi:hypothetical protein
VEVWVTTRDAQLPLWNGIPDADIPLIDTHQVPVVKAGGTVRLILSVLPRIVLMEFGSSEAAVAPPQVALNASVALPPGRIAPEGNPPPTRFTMLSLAAELGTVVAFNCTTSPVTDACAATADSSPRQASAAIIPAPATNLQPVTRSIFVARSRSKRITANPVPKSKKVSGSGTTLAVAGLALITAKSPSDNPAESLMVAEKPVAMLIVLLSFSVIEVGLNFPVRIASTAPSRPLGCPIPVESGFPTHEIPSPARVK